MYVSNALHTGTIQCMETFFYKKKVKLHICNVHSEESFEKQSHQINLSDVILLAKFTK